MFNKNHKSLLALIFCSLFLFYSPFLTKRWNNGGSQAVICWDVYGYYLYLPSLFYDELGKLNNYDYIHSTYHPGSDTKDQAFIQPNTGKYVMNYPCGQAIIELPAFSIGHLWAKAAGYKADGFTLPYQLSLTFWCVFVACLGLGAMRRLLLRYFDDWIVAVVLIVLCLATNFYNFVSFSVLTHAYLFTLYAVILWLTDSFYRSDRKRMMYVVAIGLLSGLATIVRPTEIICVLIPLLWGVSSRDSLKERIGFFWENKKFAFAYCAAAFIAALPQLLYWKIYAGHWLFFSYHGDDKTFSFLHPHVLNVLFSYQKGWFTYTPVMILSILGFYQLYKNYRSVFWCIASFTMLNIYLVSSWDCWWYGGSFSMRALIQSYALLMFPLAAFLADLLKRKYWKYLIIAILLFCTWLNLLMIYQANGSFKYGIMEGEGTTRAYYWRIFGKTEVSLKDKKLMDNNEEIPERLEPGLKEVYRTDLEDIPFADSAMALSGKRAFKLDGAKQFTDKLYIPVSNNIHKGWYRVYAKAFFPDKEWNVWDQAQFNVGFYKGDKTVKQKGIRVQRITEQGAWNEVYVDIKVPHGDYDKLGVYFWNANSTKAIYIDDIKVVYTPDE
jgi:hypothetical protein